MPYNRYYILVALLLSHTYSDLTVMSGPTMSMIDNASGGIGNYKGVMLCNRPFGGSAGYFICSDFIVFINE